MTMSWIMQLIPVFKIGIFNAWIFAVIFFLLPFLIMLFNKEAYKKGSNPADLNKKERIISYIATIVLYIAFLYSIFLPFKLGKAWFYTGLIIFLIAIALLITAMINFITTPIDKVITKGMYQYSRHPIYFSNFLALIAIGIATASWVILLVAAIFFVLANIDTVTEERYCKEKYGDIYKEYLNKTPKWIGIPKP
jgi:protein-S-isoprenylcysteine O-methyltransferase Ste14